MNRSKIKLYFFHSYIKTEKKHTENVTIIIIIILTCIGQDHPPIWSSPEPQFLLRPANLPIRKYSKIWHGFMSRCIIINKVNHGLCRKCQLMSSSFYCTLKITSRFGKRRSVDKNKYIIQYLNRTLINIIFFCFKKYLYILLNISISVCC